MRSSHRSRVRRTGIIILVVAFAVVGICLIVVYKRAKGPVYYGKPLNQWAEEALASDETIRLPAEQAIRRIGTNAIPYLMREIRCQDSGFKMSFMEFVKGHPGIKINFISASKRRQNAFEIASCFGPEPRRAFFWALEPFFDDPELIGCVGKTLLEKDYEADPNNAPDFDLFRSIARHMTNVNPRVRGSLILMASVGSSEDIAGTKLLDIWLARLKDNDTRVRAQAALAMIQFGRISEKIFTALISSLQDSNAEVRRNSADALCFYAWDDKSRQAAPFLTKALSDPDANVRAAAAKALSMQKAGVAEPIVTFP